MLQPLVRRTWSKCGRTPVLKAWDRHDRLTAITASVYEPRRKRQFSMYFQLQRRNANAASFVWFLTELRKEPKPMGIRMFLDVRANGDTHGCVRANGDTHGCTSQWYEPMGTRMDVRANGDTHVFRWAEWKLCGGTRW